MKIEDLFTAKELAMIDRGEYRPGRAVLDAKLHLCASIEREACAKVCERMSSKFATSRLELLQCLGESLQDAADNIRAMGVK